MKAKTKRTVMRRAHLITGSMLATYLYATLGNIPEIQWWVKGGILPLLILTGLWLWKGHWIRKPIIRRNTGKVPLVLVFFFCGGYLLAQSGLKGGSGSFDIGFQTMNVSPINDQLSEPGYSPFSKLFLTIGGSGHFYLNRIVLGGEGAFYGQGDQTNDIYKAELAGGHGLASIGYLLYAQKGWLVFPSLGAGAAGTGFSLIPIEREYSFQQVVQEPDQFPNQSVEFGQTSGLLRLAIHIEKFFLRADQGHFGPKLGITAGYTFATKSRFRQEEVALAGSPSFSPAGFFMSLKIGGGYFSDKK